MIKKLLTFALLFSLIYGKNTEDSSALWWNKDSATKANICEEKISAENITM